MVFQKKKIQFFARGESLIEALIASSILGFALFALLSSLYISQNFLALSQDYSLARKISETVLSRLKAEPDFGHLFQNYKDYNDSSPSGRFYILQDHTIDWSQPATVPKGAIGEGYLSFVVNEWNYPADVWGKDTAFYTNDNLLPGKIDLDGDGDAENKEIILGRTSGTPFNKRDGYYIVLPVRIVVRVYSSRLGDLVEYEKKALIFKNSP